MPPRPRAHFAEGAAEPASSGGAHAQQECEPGSATERATRPTAAQQESSYGQAAVAAEEAAAATAAYAAEFALGSDDDCPACGASSARPCAQPPPDAHAPASAAPPPSAPQPADLGGDSDEQPAPAGNADNAGFWPQEALPLEPPPPQPPHFDGYTVTDQVRRWPAWLLVLAGPRA